MSWEYGVQKYDHIDVDVYPLSDSEHWLAIVCYEWIVGDFDVGLPGATAELVGRDQDGNLVIETYSDMETNEEIIREMKEIALSDEAQEQLGDGMKRGSIYQANKAAIGDDPDLLYVGIELQIN